MKVFVTGGSGFIGQRLIRRLVERGDTVFALARSEKSAGVLSQLGAQIVPGDITNTDSMRYGMQGSDLVFHLAAWYKVGSPDWTKAEAINVGGTRKVLRLAVELNIPKIVYVSTIAVFGNTHGALVDESYYSSGPFLTEYDRTKWLAHYKVALPLIEKGAPIVIAMPGAVFGRGDTSVLAEMMRWFYRGMPVLFGPETMLTYAHVDDIVDGFLLVADKGRLGDSYILTGPAVPLGEMVDFWGHLTGRPTPILRIPAHVAKIGLPLVDLLGQFVPLPPLFSAEAIDTLGTTYIATAEKAKSELGWKTRPLQSSMYDTLRWIAEQEATFQKTDRAKRKRWAAMALLASGFLFLLWLVGRKQE